MKRFFQFSLIGVAVALLFVSLVPTKDKVPANNEVLVGTITHTLQNYHFRPIKIDDEFSKTLFETYIKNLDFGKRFLTKADIDKLKSYELKLDDELNNGSLKMYQDANKIITQRIKEAEGYYKEFLSTPFNYSTDEIIETDTDKINHAANTKELKEMWRKSLKYQVISRIYETESQQKEQAKKSDTVKIKSFDELEIESRERVMKNHDQWFTRLKRLDDADRMSAFINAATSIFDPHTNFFPPDDKENFDISMSGKLEGIGATLQEKDGYIKVTRVVPGSASWRQGELKAGHIILKVAQGDDEPVDIVDMRLDEAVKLIRGKKGTEVKLTVRKMDGSESVIPIIRDIVILEETYAKSAIVKNNYAKANIGYINLPKFYADFNDAGGRFCSKDVKAEIEKLQKENINGLILDLRNNGGGSLQDVVDMAGLFIDKGPIVQIQTKAGYPYILEDKDTTINYRGPLVILVNSFSASASEILAAAMQDYKRAIIVGSPSTYGKGTVQRFVDLEELLPTSMQGMAPLGSMKVTTQKFYRITGASTQLKGVVPDIILTDNYSYIELGEAEMDHAMEWDEIRPTMYSPSKIQVKNKNHILESSNKRTSLDSAFILTDAKARHYKEISDRSTAPLHFEKFKTLREKEKAITDKLERNDKEIDDLIIKNLKVDLKEIESDTARVAMNNEWLKELKKDIQLNEAIRIVEDMK